MTTTVSIDPQAVSAIAAALAGTYRRGGAAHRTVPPLSSAAGHRLAAQLSALQTASRRACSSLDADGARFAARTRSAVAEVLEADR